MVLGWGERGKGNGGLGIVRVAAVGKYAEEVVELNRQKRGGS